MEAGPGSLASSPAVMSGPAQPFEQAFRSLIDVLDSLPFPHCILGALALSVWAIPRATQDVDVLIGMEAAGRTGLVQAMEKAGFMFDQSWAEANPMIRDWHLRFRRGDIPIDVMLPRDAHDKALLDRRTRQSLDEQRVWMASPEDLILHKLKAGRTQDFVDVLSVVHHQRKTLDLKYLQQWASNLGIQEELSYCLAPGA